MTTVRSTLINNLVARLGAMSVGGGYHFNWDLALGGGGFTQIKQQGIDMSVLPRGIVFVTDGAVVETNNINVEETLAILIEVWTFDDGASGLSSSEIVERMVTDVQRCFLADDAQGVPLAKTWSRSVGWRPIADLREGVPYIGAEIDLEVTYHHRRADPRELPA